jgi:hypothetical protein
MHRQPPNSQKWPRVGPSAENLLANSLSRNIDRLGRGTICPKFFGNLVVIDVVAQRR